MPQSPWLVRGKTIRKVIDGTERDLLRPLRHWSGRDSDEDDLTPPVLPASSLKGVLRSTAEYILRSVDPERSPDRRPLADAPFVCGKRSELAGQPRGSVADSELIEWNEVNGKSISPEDLTPGRIYWQLSAASQLFGATVHAGLLTLDDAVGPSAYAQRSHVAISRFTGGVGKGPYQEELVLPEGSLSTTLTIRNFALWQLGLLGIVFQEVSRGYVGVGGGTRKGHGRIEINVKGLHFSYAANAYPAERVGIVSAQAYCSQSNGIPEQLRNLEARPDLLANKASAIAGPESTDWRTNALVQRSVVGPLVDQLFHEAVQEAWCPWVLMMQEEQPS